MKKFGRFFGQNPKNNAIRLRRAKALRNENAVISSKRRPRLLERGARGENMSVSFANRRMLSLRQNKDSRRVGGHAPPQRHLERSAATTKTRFTGRKRVKRSDYPLSSRLNLSSRHIQKNPSFPGHAPGKDTLRAANAATERGLTGENARANVVSGRALSPVIKITNILSPVSIYRGQRIYRRALTRRSYRWKA